MAVNLFYLSFYLVKPFNYNYSDFFTVNKQFCWYKPFVINNLAATGISKDIKFVEWKIILKQQEIYFFCSKILAINFDADIANNKNFKFFEYKTKLLGNSEANEYNGILRNVTVTVPLNYFLVIFLGITCKIKSNFKQITFCVLSAAGADNKDANFKNIVSTIKDTKLYVHVVISSAKAIKNYQNFLVKDLKDQFIGMNTKQKVRIIIHQMNIDIFSNQTLLELIDYLY